MNTTAFIEKNKPTNVKALETALTDMVPNNTHLLLTDC